MNNQTALTSLSPNLIQNAYPYPLEILRQKPWHSFTRQNGYEGLAGRLMVKVFTDLESAEILWRSLSPDKSVFDLWEIRQAFAEGFGVEKPYFITLYEKKAGKASLLGVLPLSYDMEEKTYKWYGCSWPEDNTFFVKDVELIPLLLMCAPQPISLQEIIDLPGYGFLHDFYGYKIEDEQKYILPLSSYTTVSSYIQSVRKKKRHNIRRDCKRIALYNPKITYGSLSHIENMFFLNHSRFSKPGVDKDEMSRFDIPYYRKLFRLLAQVKSPAKQVFVTTEINNKIEAVEFGFIYKKTCHAFNAGANVDKYSGLGTFSNIMLIDYAIQKQCTAIDFLYGDYNWKKSWEFTSQQPYQFELK